jgi:broad specificity phosphatase PhoE
MSKQEHYSGKTVAIVSHGLFLDFLMAVINGRTQRTAPRFAFYNTGVGLLQMQDPNPVIFYLNRTLHLSVMPLIYHNGNLV